MKQDKKKGLLISHSSGAAGAEVVFEEVVKSLGAAGAVTVMYPNSALLFPLKRMPSEDGVEKICGFYKLFGNSVLRVVVKFIATFPTILYVLLQLRWKEFGYVYVNSSLNWFGLFVAILKKKKCYLHFHELPNDSETYIDKKLDWLFSVLISLSKAHCIFISREMECYWRDRIPAIQSSTVIYNPAKNLYSQQCNSDGYVYGFAGTLYERKNVALLIRCFSAVAKKYSNVSLVIAGSGPQLDELKLLAEQCGVSHLVEFIGAVNNIQCFFERIHCFILPSLAEAMPLVAVEAMIVGRVSIVTDRCSLNEIFDDGKHCFYFSPGDPGALIDLMSKAYEGVLDYVSEEAKNRASATSSNIVFREKLYEVVG
ncbi:glycosyltransferase family 4 protein [Spongiibacter tropicus]|uniref:glycosyltransferase family 4 protein n=1 Tax=Spongiibacter tropicus TaxID=454602 RepID=UPI003009E13B